MIHGEFSKEEHDAARTELAKALVSVAWDESRDVMALAWGAIEALMMSETPVGQRLRDWAASPDT